MEVIGLILCGGGGKLVLEEDFDFDWFIGVETRLDEFNKRNFLYFSYNSELDVMGNLYQYCTFFVICC